MNDSVIVIPVGSCHTVCGVDGLEEFGQAWNNLLPGTMVTLSLSRTIGDVSDLDTVLQAISEAQESGEGNNRVAILLPQGMEARELREATSEIPYYQEVLAPSDRHTTTLISIVSV